MIPNVRTVILASVAVLPMAAAAQEDGIGTRTVEQKFAACVAEQEPERRLACFDAAAKPEAPAQTAARAAASAAEPVPAAATARDPSGPKITRGPDGKVLAAGEWIVLRTKDSMTDKPRVIVFADGEMEAGRTNKAPSINLRCFSGRIEVWFDVETYIGVRDTLQTTVRFDDAPAASARWSASTDGTAVFSPNPASFMQQLHRATNRLLIETVAFNGQRYRAKFDIEGLAEVIPDLAPCWRPTPPAQQRPAQPTAQRPAVQPRG